MFEIKTQRNNSNGRKTLATRVRSHALGNLKLACVELGISDDKHTLKRAARAFDLYYSEKVEHLNDHTFNVKSQYAERLPYQVWISPTGTSYCTCPDWRNYSGDMDYPDVHFNCKHSIAARVWLHHNGNGSKIVNDCGTSKAKELQEKLNESNGTVEHTGVAFGEPCDSSESHPSTNHQLDTSDPFQESEQLDINQIEGRSNGDLVHKLSNGKYIISYHGIMALAEQHDVTFLRHTVKSDAKRNGTVVAYARCGNNTRASGKPMNGSFITAIELAKRNAARQLLPLPEIKALEHKAKLEADFDWQVAKRKCLEIVPDFKLSIIINDLVKADGAHRRSLRLRRVSPLRQAHPSDYNRKEWLVIFDAVKKDAETNGNDNDGGTRKVSATAVERTAVGFAEACDSNTANTPSSDDEQRACDRTRQAVCCICNRTLTNKLSISRCVGPECFKKVGAQGAQFLRDDEVSDELIKASKLYRDEALQKRILRACLTLDAPPPVKALNWLGNEFFGYKNRQILYYVCADGQLNRLDTHRRKLRHVIVTSETAETELDAHALSRAIARDKQMAADVVEPSERRAGISQEEFIAKCKQAEAEVEDTTTDDAHPTNGDGKRKLQMGKDRIVWLIEADGAKKQIDYPEAERMKRNSVLRLTQGIQLCGADISTVELDD